MEKIKTVLIGLGTVNIGFLKIIINKNKELENKHDIEFVIVGVADSTGIAINTNGFNHQNLVDLKARNEHVNNLESYIPNIQTEEITEHVDAGLVIDGSPVNLETGNPGLEVVRNSLKKGWPVVLANKAPLVLAYDELHKLARDNNCQLAYSATVCGGLPVINVLQRDLKLTEMSRFRGILNATTNFILQELETGGSFDEAVKEAQRTGAAEADPSLDINGYDTANKLYIIMKSFTSYSGQLNDIQIEGIQNISENHLIESKNKGRKIKLLGIAEKIDSQWELRVKPVEVDEDSFLGSCNGWEMGIEVDTDLYENIRMKKREEDPVGTSAAVLRDAIQLADDLIGKI